MRNRAIAYVDGSYNKSEDICGWGVVFLYESDKPEYFSGSCEGLLWNVSGEINAAVFAVEKALEYGCDSIEIHYDYNGIERWVTGEWKAKKEETEIYRDKMKSFFEMIDIGFVHVKGHSGDKYNDKADGLAKMGVMILSKEDMTEDTPEDMENEEKTVSLESKKEKGLLEVGEGANEKCKKAISKFKKKCKPRFRDFVELKSFGQDKYSRLKEDKLKEILGEDVCREIREKVNAPEGYMPALKWAARGLSAEDAAHKANVDLDVSRNCIK